MGDGNFCKRNQKLAVQTRGNKHEGALRNQYYMSNLNQALNNDFLSRLSVYQAKNHTNVARDTCKLYRIQTIMHIDLLYHITVNHDAPNPTPERMYLKPPP